MTATNNSAVRESPIFFLAPMVRAILDGTKTQTRRIVKGAALELLRPDGFTPEYVAMPENSVICPFGKAGDRLWVRETWQFYDWTEYGEPCIRYAADDARLWPEIEDEQTGLKLMDVWAALSDPENYAIDNRAADRRWRPSIHMPRWACRIVPEVTGIRVERLQDISESDCIAEGIERFATVGGSAWRDYSGGSGFSVRDQHSTRSSFRSLWTSTGGDWDANPWVWVVEFKRVDNSAGRGEG